MQIRPNTIDWLLQGDPSICWQTMRDLTDVDEKAIQTERKKIAVHGWGKKLLAYQDNSGLWGSGLYSPKWISTFFADLD